MLQVIGSTAIGGVMDGAAPRSDGWVPGGPRAHETPAAVRRRKPLARVSLRRPRAMQGDGVLGLKWLR